MARPLEFGLLSSNVGDSRRGRSKVRSGRHAEGVKLAVGDTVVYPGLGAGRVTARGKMVVVDVEQEVVVLELGDGLWVTLPMQLAWELLRPLVSEAGLSRVQETLREVARSAGTSG